MADYLSPIQSVPFFEAPHLTITGKTKVTKLTRKWKKKRIKRVTPVLPDPQVYQTPYGFIGHPVTLRALRLELAKRGLT
jgi:hypothetical protein